MILKPQAADSRGSFGADIGPLSGKAAPPNFTECQIQPSLVEITYTGAPGGVRCYKLQA